MSEKSYNWDQELNEIHISFKIDETASKTSIEYIIKDRKIKITYNGKVILEGVLQKRVEVGSEYWVKNGDTIDFYITKQKNDWWECLIEGSETVDVSKLAENSNVDFSMLDPEAREMIEKMAYESKIKASNEGMDNNEGMDDIEVMDNNEGMDSNEGMDDNEGMDSNEGMDEKDDVVEEESQ